ncbi:MULTISPECIES: 50S ribosomal protein L16 [Chlamydia]|jgi:ribosomal protein L16, bacterial/organelle|uniref:Large ribosomal subunit protein uL16 n=5 Tax=Chlamydia TaxID=810 RepID=RL16_CHLMU|nr:MULTISPECIES: 50S ribosomal protein L16 [Chlamydia]B0B895.1 RecName: Full=Large ribosomal subunit protein uL16; AltName: Full=50S ribosomal protein L16 [Chlamydia trachomatis 434/Bu]B0BCG0.1 RecName: Full=Large ribosomal subunit protein uL16; AltName: Full=50S ribosomal protein L16 [Chlamydia trachomatis L2b/UCH-1/proctitis]Q9PJM1.1 RecName: Full=Large ribosomal subunit protein uL16; AltName: Full=50S ribosomal protein L16 [Chlamydia muridarum str. Nigg]AAF39611.1 ribosomal protein L16 [Chla
MLMPKRTKFRKQQKGQFAGLSKGATFVDFGEFGMQTLERGWITSRQIEACRVAINRYLKRKGKVWIRVFPDKSVTKKPAETRMGKGKGAPDHWVAVVRPGRILFEVANVSKEDAQDALRRAAAKLGIRTRFVKRVERV